VAVPERFKAAVAVYGLLRRDGLVLLLRRANSGFHDGELALPAGHVDEGESALSAIVRELREEVVLDVRPQDCRLALTGHAGPERPGDDTYVDLYFTVDRWVGEPRIGEPDRAVELVWAPVDDLPGDVVGFMAEAIGTITGGTDQRLRLWNWPPSIDQHAG
jgi:8-oxo-dGTP pyrophosphatase MutT (NUDIX family)